MPCHSLPSFTPHAFQHKQSHCLQNLDRSRNEVFRKQPPHSNVQNKEVLMKERKRKSKSNEKKKQNNYNRSTNNKQILSFIFICAN